MSWLEDSSTYQMLLDRGRIDEARKLLLRQGQIRFGPPDAPTRTAIETLKDLERLSERLLDALSWAELLAQRCARGRNDARLAVHGAAAAASQRKLRPVPEPFLYGSFGAWRLGRDEHGTV
jgi:hypothetical protein